VFSKYPEAYPALNPTVQVVLRPTPASLGPSPTAIMKATISTLQQAFPDFRLVDPISGDESLWLSGGVYEGDLHLTHRERDRFPGARADVGGAPWQGHVPHWNEWNRQR
jgi:hypothetical protein